MANISTAFDVEGLVEQKKALDALLSSNPDMEKKLQGAIRKVLTAARSSLAKDAKSEMGSDPRKAYKAVRSVVYRRILGGSVNILNKKRRGAAGSYTPTRTLRSGQVGGNRRPRSERTKNLESYQGSDRGFILRFINAGTDARQIEFTPDPRRERVNRGARGGSRYGKTINTGYRGRIGARNWFGRRSHQEMEQAAMNLEKYIDELIKNEMK